MDSRINFVLLICVTLSALYLVEKRFKVKYQTMLYGSALRNKVDLEAAKAELRYENSRYSNPEWFLPLAHGVGMRHPEKKEIVELKFNE